MSNKLFLLPLLLSVFIFQFCTESSSDSSNSVNPNGDSELAVLMREMFDEGALIKEGILNGEPVEFKVNYEEMLTAEATEPEKAASDEYKQFASSYLSMVNAMKEGDTETGHDTYNGMVESCVQCHKAMCPGPLVKINKLKLPKEPK